MVHFWDKHIQQKFICFLLSIILQIIWFHKSQSGNKYIENLEKGEHRKTHISLTTVNKIIWLIHNNGFPCVIFENSFDWHGSIPQVMVFHLESMEWVTESCCFCCYIQNSKGRHNHATYSYHEFKSQKCIIFTITEIQIIIFL